MNEGECVEYHVQLRNIAAKEGNMNECQRNISQHRREM